MGIMIPHQHRDHSKCSSGFLGADTEAPLEHVERLHSRSTQSNSAGTHAAVELLYLFREKGCSMCSIEAAVSTPR